MESAARRYFRIAIFHQKASRISLFSSNGRTLPLVKVSPRVPCCGIVCINGQVYGADRTGIFIISCDGKTFPVADLNKRLDYGTEIISLRDWIYLLEPFEQNMVRLDSANKTPGIASPGCLLGYGFCCCASDEFIYAMGGRRTDSEAMKYDPLENTWADITKMKYGRFWSSAAAFNNRIYVLGGKENHPPECYDPRSSTWSEIPRMIAHRSLFSSCVINDQLYVVGGERDGNDIMKQRQTVEIFNGNVWETAGDFAINDGDNISACVWPHVSDHAGIEEDVKRRLAEHIPRKSGIIGHDGCAIQVAGTDVVFPEKCIVGEKEISVSSRTVTEEEDNLIDVTPRLDINPPLQFSVPVSVKMETSVSASPGESVPLIVQQRNNPGEEWKEVNQLSLSEKNEVAFTLDRGGETKVAVDTRDRNNKKKKLKVHVLEDFYIHSDTGEVIATFCKDRNTRQATEKSCRERSYIPFAVIQQSIIAELNSTIRVRMECSRPKKSKISETVLPDSTFKLDKNFVAKGTHTVYFELDPPPSEDSELVKLMYECYVHDDLEHKIPLITKWSQIETPSTHRTPESKTSDISQAATEPIQNDTAEKVVTMAEILTKENQVLVICYSQGCNKITGMIEQLKRDEYFKRALSTAMYVSHHNYSPKLELQLTAFPPNGNNVTINPSCHDVCVKEIRKGLPVPYNFICKSRKGVAIEAVLGLNVRKAGITVFKSTFEMTLHGKEEAAASLVSNSNIEQLNVIQSAEVVDLSRNQQ